MINRTCCVGKDVGSLESLLHLLSGSTDMLWATQDIFPLHYIRQHSSETKFYLTLPRTSFPTSHVGPINHCRVCFKSEDCTLALAPLTFLLCPFPKTLESQAHICSIVFSNVTHHEEHRLLNQLFVRLSVAEHFSNTREA